MLRDNESLFEAHPLGGVGGIYGYETSPAPAPAPKHAVTEPKKRKHSQDTLGVLLNLYSLFRRTMNLRGKVATISLSEE